MIVRIIPGISEDQLTQINDQGDAKASPPQVSGEAICRSRHH